MKTAQKARGKITRDVLKQTGMSESAISKHLGEPTVSKPLQQPKKEPTATKSKKRYI